MTTYAVIDKEAWAIQFEKEYPTLKEAVGHCSGGNYIVAIEDGVVRQLTPSEMQARQEETDGLLTSAVRG